MRRLVVLLMVGALLVGCTPTAGPSAPVSTPGSGASAPAPGTAAPPDKPNPGTSPVSPATVPTDKPNPYPGPVTEPTTAVNHAALAPFFAATASSFEGVFLVQGEQLSYAKGDTQVPVLKGRQPRALAIRTNRALVTDGEKLFWFHPADGSVQAIEGAPAANQAAVYGDTYLLAAGKKVYSWKPPAPPVELAAPEHLYAVYGVSISPDGRYGAVAYDLDIPQGPRAGVLWIFDLQTGTVLKWPAEQPKFQYGLWLLGWSRPDTVRFMTGSRGYNVGHTWALPGAYPGKEDGTHYTAIDVGVSTSADGSWVTYRESTGRMLLQSVQPDSKAVLVYEDKNALDYPRILLNGNLAVRTRYPNAWWEITREGTVRRWDGVDWLY